MEKLEANMDDGSSPLDQKQEDPQERKRREAKGVAQMLVHAGQCSGTNCLVKTCNKMKRAIQHTKTCKRKINGSCPICKQLIALCCYHSKHCHETNCSVPFCLKIKHKLKEHQLQYKFQQTQLVRRRLTAMNTSSTVPSGTLPGNSSMGVLAGGAVGQPGAGNMVQEEAAQQQTPHAGFSGGIVTPLGVIGGQSQVMARPPIGPIGPSNANQIPTIDLESMPDAAVAALKQEVQQLLQVLNSPITSEKQQRIHQMLNSNPLLMVAYIKERQLYHLQQAQQAAVQEHAEQLLQEGRMLMQAGPSQQHEQQQIITEQMEQMQLQEQGSQEDQEV